MPPQNERSLEIAKITSRQAVLVAIISAAAGIVTTLVGTYLSHPRSENEPTPLVGSEEAAIATRQPGIYMASFITKADANGRSTCISESIKALNTVGFSVEATNEVQVVGGKRDYCRVGISCTDLFKPGEIEGGLDTMLIACDSDADGAKKEGREILDKLVVGGATLEQW